MSVLIRTFDLHVHTTAGSLDAELTPDALVGALRRSGVQGTLVAEHLAPWPDHLCSAYGDESRLLIPGIELAFGRDHLLVLTPNGLMPAKVQELRRSSAPWDLYEAVHELSGIVVLAHPFRYYWERWDQDDPVRCAAAREVLDYVDAVEVVNGGCTDAENHLALELARLRNLPHTAGSDAHHEHSVGYAVLEFDVGVQSAADVIEGVLDRRGDIYVRRHGRRVPWLTNGG